MIDLDQKISLLHSVSLFQGLEDADLSLIAQKVSQASFEEGEFVFREGEVGHQLYILIYGKMHVFVESAGDVITYDRLAAGECFGEMALLDGSPRSGTVKAETVSSCITLSRPDFLSLLYVQPSIALSMLSRTFRRLRGTNTQLQEYASRLRTY